MTEDQLLFASALAHPAEDTPRLALADWFDEHDEPDLAAALRASKEMVAFLGGLIRWDALPVRRVREFVDGEPRELLPVLPAAQLLTRYRDLFPAAPDAPTAFGEPPRQLECAPDPASFLGQWQSARHEQIAALRERAARGSAGSATVRPTFNALPDARAFEEQSCSLHELLIRGRAPSAIPGALDHAARMRERGHPLARLPLSLLPVESELPHRVARFSPGGGVGTAGALPEGDPLPIRALGADVPAVVGAEAFALESPALAAVRGYAEESNGELEGVVFRLDRPLDPDAVGRLWFSRLPADSLNAALVTAHWFVSRVAASEAFGALFGAAQTGGAYGGGAWGAYGRLRAWQSLGALAGCDPGASAEEVAAEAERGEWLAFGGTEWFHLLPPDLGLMCVRPDRLSVALLAATDTD